MVANYRREVLESQVEVQKQAFEQVGAELYDNIGQMLSVAKMYLYSLEDTDLNQEQRTYIQQTNDIVGQSISDLRGLIRQLQGCMTKSFNLQECVSQYLQQLRRNRHIATELLVTGIPHSQVYEKEIILFRVIQEVLTTIFKDEKTTSLRVGFHYDSTLLKIVLESDGQTYLEKETEMQTTPQWQDIQRRVKLAGGQCSFETPSEQTIKVTIETKLKRHSPTSVLS
ncbi:MAG: histidine kinase [Spirosomataceae bacterium]